LVFARKTKETDTMNASLFFKGTLLATAVAGMFACASTSQQSGGSATPAAAASGQVVKCEGINECKGHSDCGGGTHHCASQNECKGKGWVKTASQDECVQKGGKVI
jgi:hypothetical protein